MDHLCCLLVDEVSEAFIHSFIRSCGRDRLSTLDACGCLQCRAAEVEALMPRGLGAVPHVCSSTLTFPVVAYGAGNDVGCVATESRLLGSFFPGDKDDQARLQSRLAGTARPRSGPNCGLQELMIHVCTVALLLPLLFTPSHFLFDSQGHQAPPCMPAQWNSPQLHKSSRAACDRKAAVDPEHLPGRGSC